MKKLYLSLGLRNVLRNKRRTFITAGVIAVGLSSMILAHGFTDGFMNYMVNSATSDFFGQGRIHHKEYDAAKKSRYYIHNKKEIIKLLNSDVKIKNFTERTMTEAMIASPENNLNISLVGILPNNEKSFSKLSKNMIKGDFLTNNSLDSEILIGSEIAKSLKIDLDSRVVVTFSNIKTSEIVQELFKVKGIYSYRSKAMDKGFAFIKIGLSQRLLGIGSGIHEIAMDFKKINRGDESPYLFEEILRDSEIEFKSWEEFLPTLKATSDVISESIGFVAIFMGFLVALAVANTIYMSLYERVFEFGVIKAIGTRSIEIKKMIFVEALSLGVVGVFIGLVLVFFLGGYMAIYGLDYSGTSYANVSLRDPIYFEFSFIKIAIYSISTILFVGLVSLIPARFIMKIQTSVALRSRG